MIAYRELPEEEPTPSTTIRDGRAKLHLKVCPKNWFMWRLSIAHLASSSSANSTNPNPLCKPLTVWSRGRKISLISPKVSKILHSLDSSILWSNPPKVIRIHSGWQSLTYIHSRDASRLRIYKRRHNMPLSPTRLWVNGSSACNQSVPTYLRVLFLNTRLLHYGLSFI